MKNGANVAGDASTNGKETVMTKSLVQFDGFGVAGSILPEHVEQFGDTWTKLGSAIKVDAKRTKAAQKRMSSAAAIVAEVTKQRAAEYIDICAAVGYVSGKYTDQTQPVNVFLNACDELLGIKRSSISTAAARLREERNPALKDARKEQQEQDALERAKKLVAEKSPEVTIPNPTLDPVESTFSVISNLWDGLVERQNKGDDTVIPTLTKGLVDFVLDVANLLDDADLLNLQQAVGALVEGRTKEAAKTAKAS